MWPHVYAGVTEDMRCFHEELFGPAVTLVKADDFDHALHLANASPYGLSSAIYTNDRLEAYRFKTGIKAGMTGINNSTTGAEAHLPFGGVKGSETVRENLESGLLKPILTGMRSTMNSQENCNLHRWMLTKLKWLKPKSDGTN